MQDTTIRKIFGGQRLQAADAGVIATLESLGPWGIAAVAAYLAGQGLAQLAQKIQSMRTTTGFTQRVPLTAEETTKIQQAISAIQMSSLPAESQAWIKNYPPAGIKQISRSVEWENTVSLENAQSWFDSQSAALPPPSDPNRCNQLHD